MLVLPVLMATGAPSPVAQQVREENEALFRQLKEVRGLTDSQLNAVRRFSNGPATSVRGTQRSPVTLSRRSNARRSSRGKAFTMKTPGLKNLRRNYLAPLYDPATQRPEDAEVCIDQFEFPNIPCAYPVVWVKAREAAEICSAIGERLADAHEWEGACQGDLQRPDYRFDLARGLSPNAAVERMRAEHNRTDAATKRWSYGPEYRKGICATSSQKTPGCNGGSWTGCG